MSAEKVEIVDTPKETTTAAKSGGIAGHFKKWWWAYLIVLIVIVLVVVLPVVYVAYPKIAQKDINKSSLEVTSMVISNPTADTFYLNQTQTIINHASYHPKLYAFEAAVSMLGLTSTIAKVLVPTSHANNGAEVHIAQTVNITDSTEFDYFAAYLLGLEEFALNIYGKPHLKEGSLPKISVTYNQTVVMKGLNYLEGFEVTGFNILTTEEDGKNVNGSVLIPNPSVVTLHMGNVTLNLDVDGTVLGYIYLEDLVLAPGNNTVPMTATVDEVSIIEMLSSNDTTFADGVVPFNLIGNSSVYDGVVLPYFTVALQALNLTTSLNVTEALVEAGL
ncbi:hypothetical protein N7540_010884 [Penicillium herquei]|nr:hypothetical protein N7540_010884 [Penicillium herquei]